MNQAASTGNGNSPEQQAAFNKTKDNDLQHFGKSGDDEKKGGPSGQKKQSTSTSPSRVGGEVVKKSRPDEDSKGQTSTQQPKQKDRPSDDSDVGISEDEAKRKILEDQRKKQEGAKPSNIVSAGFYNPIQDSKQNQTSGKDVTGAPKTQGNRNNIDPKTGQEVEDRVPGAFGTTRERPVRDDLDLGASTRAGLPQSVIDRLESVGTKQQRQPEEDALPYGVVPQEGDEEEEEQAEEDIGYGAEDLLPLMMAQQEEEEEENKKRNYISLVHEGLRAMKMDAMDDDQILEMIYMSDKVKFPGIMFSICFIYELGSIIFSMVSLILSAILLPIGMGGFMTFMFTGFTSTIIFFLWSNYYAANASEYTKKLGVVRRFVVRRLFIRAFTSFVKIIPIFGGAIPVETFMVWYAYKFQVKTNRKLREIVANAQAESGYYG
jgi:hypothetical protein